MAELSTYDDIVTAFYALIKDSADTGRLAKTDQIDIWANSTMAEMAEHAEYIDYDYVPSVDLTGVSTITVTHEGDLMGLWRVEIEDEYIDPTTTRELYGSSRTWQAQTGRPRWYYLDSMRVDDGITLGIWPKSNADYDIRMIFTTSGDQLSYANKDERVMLPLWATPGLLWSLLHKFYNSENRMQNRNTAAFYKIMYDDVMTRLRARSYSRVNRFKAWGESRGRKTSGDLRQLLPSDGFPYP